MGLISLWQTWFEPNARPCLNDKNDNRNVKKKEKKQLTRISLANLTGAFVLLAVGCMISVFVFLMEKVVARWKINHITVL
jgi:ionotropic glutamate receptor